jgi:hypothetical protein
VLDNTGNNDNIFYQVIQKEAEEDAKDKKNLNLRTLDRHRVYSHLTMKNQGLHGKLKYSENIKKMNMKERQSSFKKLWNQYTPQKLIIMRSSVLLKV